MASLSSKALLTALLAVSLATCSQKSSPRSGLPGREALDAPTASADPSSSSDEKAYLGRRLASPMSYLGADWLERADREATEEPEKAISALGLRRGDTVADVGAGSGYLTERLSRRVGPEGRVLATDLQPEMLAMIKAKVEAKGLSNVETILATASNANLPRHAVDVVLMVDVYHELPEPKATLAQIREALKPHGILALVEYRAEDPNVPIKEEHKMTLAQIEKELRASSFVIRRVDESLPLQRVVIASPTSDDSPR